MICLRASQFKGFWLLREVKTSSSLHVPLFHIVEFFFHQMCLFNKVALTCAVLPDCVLKQNKTEQMFIRRKA